jgi:hypothetical protein
LALLTLKATGTCEFTIPEWLYIFDGPSHYGRRIKYISISTPSNTGPYTTVSCTLSLLKSSIRKSPLLKDGEYARDGSEDDRFSDYYGTIDSFVTSSAINDPGMFETNLHDEKRLPFEGSGAECTLKLELPPTFRQFDYDTISDVILHIRYTAREGGSQLGAKAAEYLEDLVADANAAGLGLLFSLKHDFPSEWQKFVTANANSPTPNVPFSAKVKRNYFPYFTQGKDVVVNSIQILNTKGGELTTATLKDDLVSFSDDLNSGEATFSPALAGSVADVLAPNLPVFIIIKYSLE